MNDDYVMSLIGFGMWFCWLMVVICIAGFIGDSFHRRHDKANDYLKEVVNADRVARVNRDKAA